MSACTMLFLKPIFSPFSCSLHLRCSFFYTSKLSGVKPTNEPETQANEDCRKRREIDMTEFLLNECGLSESQVLTIGRRREELFKCKSIRRAKEAVQLFRDSGFTQDQVRKIVFINPISLQLKVDTQLKPKIEFIKSLGFSGSNLGHIVSRVPGLFNFNLEQNLSPKIPLLVDLYGSKVNLSKILMCFPRILLSKIHDVKPNIDLLKQSNMQDEILLYVIRSRPYLILGSEERLKLKIKYVKNLGVLEGSKAFATALSTVDCSGLEIFKKKLKHMASLGLLENEVLHIVRKFPSSLSNGIDKITKNMVFLKNTAGFQPNIVVSYPSFLSYSVENRLQPRHKVIEFLMKTDPTRLPKNVATVYKLSIQQFAEKFLMGSPEATKLFEQYKGKSVQPAVS